MQRLKELFSKKQPDAKLESQEAPCEEICVVGAGLTGLATIASLMKLIKEANQSKKYKIKLIEKRDFNFSRTQKLIVTPGSLKGLEDSVNWEKFAMELFNPNDVYQIDKAGKLFLRDGTPVLTPNNREKFIRKLLRLASKERVLTNFSIKSLQKALLEYIEDPANKAHNLEFEKFGETDILAVNLKDKNKKSFTVKNKTCEQKMTFDTLLLCEGEGREVTTLVSNAMKANNIRPFTFHDFSHLPSYHCVIRLKMKSLEKIENGRFKDYKTLFKENKNFSYNEKEVLNHLKKLGWDKPYFPGKALNTNFRPEYTGKKPNFGFSSDIPESIFRLPEKTEEERQIKNARLIEWSIALAAYTYKLPMEYFEIDLKHLQADKLPINLFAPERKYIDRPVAFVEGGYIVSLGDGAISPYHVEGVSAIGAANVGMRATKCIVDTDQTTPYRFTPVFRAHNLIKTTQAQNIYKSEIAKDDPFRYESRLTSPLIDATKAGNIQVVRELLQKGENPNHTKLATPLYFAIKSARYEIATELLNSGADANAEPLALIAAISKNDIQALDLLLSYGASANLNLVQEIALAEEAISTAELAQNKMNLDIITELMIAGMEENVISVRTSNQQLLEHVAQISKVKDDYLALLTMAQSKLEPGFYNAMRNEILVQFKAIIKANQLSHIFMQKDKKAFIEHVKDTFALLNRKWDYLKKLDSLANFYYKNGMDYPILKKHFDAGYKNILTNDNEITLLNDMLKVANDIKIHLESTTSTSTPTMFQSQINNEKSLQIMQNFIELTQNQIKVLPVSSKLEQRLFG